jgi:hypothetical protein
MKRSRDKFGREAIFCLTVIRRQKRVSERDLGGSARSTHARLKISVIDTESFMLMNLHPFCARRAPNHFKPFAILTLFTISAAGASSQAFNPKPLPVSLPPLVITPTSNVQLTYDFSQPILIGPSEATNTWYTDRYAPSGFATQATAPDTTTNTLEESISSSSYQTPAPSFYNTQGRKLDLVPGVYSETISLYVPAAWATGGERMAGAWGTLANTAGTVGDDFGIIEFQGGTTGSGPSGPGAYPNGGLTGFYGWDNTANNGDGGFTFIGLPPYFAYNTWVNLTMTVVAGQGIEYKVSDSRSTRGVSILTGFFDASEVSISNLILEGYNYGSSYNVFWNDLTLLSSSLACQVQPVLTDDQQAALQQHLQTSKAPLPPGSIGVSGGPSSVGVIRSAGRR